MRGENDRELHAAGSLHGIMQKKSRGRKHTLLYSWNERLFILYPQVLKIVYFLVPEVSSDWTQTNPPLDLRRGELNLIDATVTSISDTEAGRKFAFHISSPSGEITIAATKASQREEWLRALKCLSPIPHLLLPNTHFISSSRNVDISPMTSEDDSHVFHMDSWSSTDSSELSSRLNHWHKSRGGVASLPKQKKRIDSGLLLRQFSGMQVSPATSEEEDSPRLSCDEPLTAPAAPHVVKHPYRRSADKYIPIYAFHNIHRRRLRELAMESNAANAAQHEHLRQVAWRQRQLQEMTQHEQEILADWDHYGVKPAV